MKLTSPAQQTYSRLRSEPVVSLQLDSRHPSSLSLTPTNIPKPANHGFSRRACSGCAESGASICQTYHTQRLRAHHHLMILWRIDRALERAGLRLLDWSDGPWHKKRSLPGVRMIGRAGGGSITQVMQARRASETIIWCGERICLTSSWIS